MTRDDERDFVDGVRRRGERAPEASVRPVGRCVEEALEELVRRSGRGRAEVVREVVELIRDAVDDPEVHPSVDDRIAQAVADGRIPAEELHRTLASLRRQREAGRVRSSCAYWLTCARRLCQRHEVPW